MCTLSWLEHPDGYELFFNRDESRLRARGRPPEIWQRGPVRFLAPVDAEAGGTWVAANEFGLTVALLNLYPQPGETPQPQPTDPISRGLLVERLAASPHPTLLRAQLVPEALSCYRPFTLVALALDAPTWVGRWDGERLRSLEVDLPLLSSSGYDARQAEEIRRELWRSTVAQGVPDHEARMAFHRSHEPERGAFSPCMHRDDAATVSFTWVRMSKSEVAMAYADGPPCRTPLGERRTIPRRADAVIA